MSEFDVLLKGIVAGLLISAPVGPVNVLCISQTLEKGFRAGLLSGLGAATADTFYGAMAGFSVEFVIGFLIREESRLRLFGGILLIAIGVYYCFRTPRGLTRNKRVDPAHSEGPTHSDYVSALLLNLTNPTTVLSFLAVLTALGLDHHKPWWESLTLVAGILAGAMLWWVSVAAVARRFRGRLTDRAMVWMNRAAGIAIGGFGLVTLALSRAS